MSSGHAGGHDEVSLLTRLVSPTVFQQATATTALYGGLGMSPALTPPIIPQLSSHEAWPPLNGIALDIGAALRLLQQSSLVESLLPPLHGTAMASLPPPPHLGLQLSSAPQLTAQHDQLRAHHHSQPRLPQAAPYCSVIDSAPADRRHAAGFIFLCDDSTEQECLSRSLLGLPVKQISQMQQVIGDGTLMFLWNFSKRRLYGPLMPAGAPALDIVKGAFRGKFAAQIRCRWGRRGKCQVSLKQRLECGPISIEEMLRLLNMLHSAPSSGQSTAYYQDCTWSAFERTTD